MLLDDAWEVGTLSMATTWEVISGIIRGLICVIRVLSRVIDRFKFGREAPKLISMSNPT